MNSAPATSVNANQGPMPAAAGRADPAARDDSVMRQTQALIGVVLLAATGAAYATNPAWMAVPGVVGLGLLAAGITGNCPMAWVLARMPWNRAAVPRQERAGGCCCKGRCQ